MGWTGKEAWRRPDRKFWEGWVKMAGGVHLEGKLTER